MVSLADLKKKSQSNLEKFKQKTATENSFSSSEDNRFWRIDRDKAGNAFAIIRFLPSPKVDEESDATNALPWVKVFSHSFQNKDTGHWYIENSLSTIGKSDIIGEVNRKLWNSGVESDKAKAREQKRKLSYYSNVYIVKDGNNPENEGQVKIFRYGQKIFDKINNLINPDAAFGDDSSDPFDFWKGRDFKLKIRTVEGYANYDLSEFAPSAPISDKNGEPLADEEIEKVWADSHSLLEFLSPKNFKTPEELQARYDFVMNGAPKGTTSAPKTETRSETVVEKKEAPKATSSVADDDDIDIDALLNDL